MKTFIFLVFFMIFSLQAQNKQELATKEDIKTILREMDKRFEQIDKRFEQIDKRLNFLENLIIILIAGMIGSPFLIEYLARRRNEYDRFKIEESFKTVIALRELAKVDPKVRKALKVAGIKESD